MGRLLEEGLTRDLAYSTPSCDPKEPSLELRDLGRKMLHQRPLGTRRRSSSVSFRGDKHACSGTVRPRDVRKGGTQVPGFG